MEILVKENSYKIDIDYKSDDKLRDFLRERSESKFLIITDENVFSLYEERIKNIMNGLEYFIFKLLQEKNQNQSRILWKLISFL